MTRNYLQELLRINNVSLSAPSEEIVEIFTSAGIHDTETALALLQSESGDADTEDVKKNILYSDTRLNEEGIARELGLGYQAQVRTPERMRHSGVTFWHVLCIFFLSLVVAAGSVAAIVWQAEGSLPFSQMILDSL